MRKFFEAGILYLSLAALVGMMYPKYCFADGAYRIIIEESGRELVIPCDEEDYFDIFGAQKDQIRIKSRLLEYIEEYLAEHQ